MVAKAVFVILSAGMLALCNGGAIPIGLQYAGAPVPVGAAALAPVPVAKVLPNTDFDPHPQYSYAYDVRDAITGDSKSQHENRNGDVVSGSYSLIEPDGTRRIVEYTADPINGFNAVVHREPVALVKPVVAHAAAPLAYHH